MQYFTFVGTTDYIEVDYFFEDSINKIYKTRFIQEAIVNKFVDEIDEIFVFCTDISREVYEKALRENVAKKFNKNLEFIEVPFNVSTEIVISEMQKVLKDDFIFDITHSFRNIPITVMLIINYLEYASKFKLKHLYYGNIQTKQIVDLLKQYQHSRLTNDLEAFNNYLKVSPKALEEYADDRKITALLQSFENFNHMIEYCEFDHSINSLRSIVEKSKSILKEKESYILLEPYLKTIISKFEIFVSSKMKVFQKIELIKILLEHNLIQVSITFLDQLIREEIVHYYYFPRTKDFSQNLLKNLRLGQRNFTPTLYSLSQDLFYELNIRKTGKSSSQYEITLIRNQYNDLKKDVTYLQKECFENFYVKVRNSINHGGQIDENVNVKDIIDKCLIELEKFVREG